MNRTTLIKWTGIGVFALSSLCVILTASLGPMPTTMLCLAVALIGVLAIVCEVL